jgi:prepilin-type N-terminal cleavage/methylation domain-containing protein
MKNSMSVARVDWKSPGSNRERGFSLLELMVALVVTMIISGAVFGLMAQGQGTFQREPGRSERQQQIRIAMDRIQKDVLMGGAGLGPLVQAFGPNLDAVGALGVTAGENSDFLEIRLQTPDCPSVLIDPANPRNGSNYNSASSWPDCYPEPGWVLAFFPDGNAKWGWGHNQHGGGNQKFNFPPGQQPTGSQMEGVANLSCSVDLNVVGAPCPAGNEGEAIFFAQMDMYRYQIANDTDGTPSLFRSSTGGFDGATEAFSNPPGTAWQLIARGIEDMQVRYRVAPGLCGGDASGWRTTAPIIIANAAVAYSGASDDECIVREVEVTLWARVVGDSTSTDGATTAANGVTAIRGSMMTTVSPRASVVGLAAANQWH